MWPERRDAAADERALLLAGAFPLVGRVLARALSNPWPTVADLRRAAADLHREARRIRLAADRVDELTAELFEDEEAA